MPARPIKSIMPERGHPHREHRSKRGRRPAHVWLKATKRLRAYLSEREERRAKRYGRQDPTED